MTEPLYYEFNSFRVDIVKRKLLRNGERIPLTGKAFDLLVVLLQNPEKVFIREQLIREVWGGSIVTDNNFNVTLRTVRKALGEAAQNPQYILTTPEGYRFIAPVKHAGEDDHPQTDQQMFVPDEIQTKPGLLGNHFWHIFAACFMYASLYGIALLVEISYEFDRYKESMLKIAPIAFSWILLTAIAGLAFGWKREVQGRPNGMVFSFLAFFLAAILLFGILFQFLPSVPITQAKFQTHTAQSVYLKEVLYFCTLVTLFLVMPFHFVLALERELAEGRQDNALALLTGNKQAVSPKGSIYIKPQLLGFLLGMITIWALIVRAYVLDQLQPGPYMNLFMGFYYIRLFLFLALPAYCLIWYFRALNDLKRQCLNKGHLAFTKES